MKRELTATTDQTRWQGENEWTREHERRRRNWTEQERRLRKERRRCAPMDSEDAEPRRPFEP